ncbi:hypothetical protein HHK36_023451 [Tetracentron sinense]|uniref:Transmembrane protein n=1 Tax=Tetracentron sinense TaxID=13715 RepID=A0A834YNR1_TETSI|nr:hypothetical protein HHK36_023451 [Tetracentron sinense]
MEALWKLEDKLKLNTQEALLLLMCTALAVVGLCATTTIIKKKRIRGKINEEPSVVETMNTNWPESRSRWGSVKRALMGSVRWSGASKWEEHHAAPPLLMRGGSEAEVGWQSHNSVSPVWQRPILMGEKCELPRFSGLILYDEQGRPVHDSIDGIAHQEKPAAVVTTLRDLL